MSHYQGPTTAERFVDDLQARASLAMHDLPRPPQLEMESISGRYLSFAIRQEKSEVDGFLNEVMFMDGSVAVRNARKRWEAR